MKQVKISQAGNPVRHRNQKAHWQFVTRALAEYHGATRTIPRRLEPAIDWLQQTIDSWNKNSRSFVWNGKPGLTRQRLRD